MQSNALSNAHAGSSSSASTPRRAANIQHSSTSAPSLLHIDAKPVDLSDIGRRQMMCLKDSELFVAAGSEIRMTSVGEIQESSGSLKAYKTLHIPSIQFDIHQIALNSTGKLLAVAGMFNLSVVVLPPSGTVRNSSTRVDCKCVQVGEDYHTDGLPPVAKIDWHPWGDADSTLMVMTKDGKFREYDVSVHPKEPQQTISFIPESKRGRYALEDDLEREMTSFTLGGGKADWGPLTLYGVTRGGEIYAICPYLPRNASVPAAFVPSLECYVSAKQEFLTQPGHLVDESFLSLYDHQQKYVKGLARQLPTVTHSSLSVSMHPPGTVKNRVVRQGPFLLQPAPVELHGSLDAEATDLCYVTFSSGSVEDDDDILESLQAERFGAILVAFRDGRVDVCLDLDKVEAKWELKHSNLEGLPALTVFETIDLALPTAKDVDSSDFLERNHPVLRMDSVHDDTIYVYHSFGVHLINLGPVVKSLLPAFRDEGDLSMSTQDAQIGCSVTQVLDTFSREYGTATPVLAMGIPNDVYDAQRVFVLTSNMDVISLVSQHRDESRGSLYSSTTIIGSPRHQAQTPSLKNPPGPSSFLSRHPFSTPPVLTRPPGIPADIQKLLQSMPKNVEIQMSPSTLRVLATVVDRYTAEVREVQLAHSALSMRASLQQKDLELQSTNSRKLISMIDELKGARRDNLQSQMKKLQEERMVLFDRIDHLRRTSVSDASPELNDSEAQWFKELRRINGRVAGSTPYDQNSLAARVIALERDFTRLMPTLRQVGLESTRRRTSQGIITPGCSTLTQSSAYRQQHVKLEQIIKRVTRLDGKLQS